MTSRRMPLRPRGSIASIRTARNWCGLVEARDAVKDAVNQHLGTGPAHDDISLLIIDLPRCAGGSGN